MKKILILYFSGVGATKKIAELMHARLSRDCEVDIFSIEQKNIPNGDFYDGLIIGTPVYHGAPSKSVMKYWEQMPRLKKSTPAFVFNTRGSHSFNTNRILSRKLYEKNIKTLLDREYRAPASDGTIIVPFVKRFFAFEKDIEKKIEGDCAAFLELLNKGEHKGYIPRFRLGSIVNGPNKWLGQRITLKIHLHKNKCIRCGQCIKKCPHSAMITDEDDYPFCDKNACENCYRCIHHCPRIALSLRKRRTLKKLLRY